MIHPLKKSPQLTWPSSPLRTSTRRSWQSNKLECFKFAKGNWRDEQCRWSHDSSTKKFDRRTSHSGREVSRPAENIRGKSPTRYTSQCNPSEIQGKSEGPYDREKNYRNNFRNEQRPSSYGQERGYNGSKGGKGKGGRNYPMFPPPDNACQETVKTGSCTIRECQKYHGKSADDGAECFLKARGRPCPYVWSHKGCKGSHKAV